MTAGGYSTDYAETLNLAEKYDANADAWVNITSMPTPRGDVMCAALNGEFVVAGGFYDPTNEFTPASFRTEVQAYNPSTGDRMYFIEICNLSEALDLIACHFCKPTIISSKSALLSLIDARPV